MKIISINIERNKHLTKVLPFLESEKPDVACLQEVMESSVPIIANRFNYHATFVPYVKLRGWESDTEDQMQGIALLSHKPHDVLAVHYYEGAPNGLVLERGTPCEKLHDIVPRAVLVCACRDDADEEYTVGTTHFTYTPDGKPDRWQEESLDKLINFLTPYSSIVLTGDFNIPRPNRLYETLKREFTDTIPSSVLSTLDPVLHRKRGLLRAVDYFWTRGTHRAVHVEVRQGVSDHCAIVGEVRLAEK